MGFTFKFETVLKHRRHLEDIARRDFMEAQRKLDDCLEGINSLYQSVDGARSGIAAQQKVGDGEALQGIRATEQFIEGQKIRIQNERQRARTLMTKVEEMHEKLVEAVKEYKKIEKLRDRMKVQYKKEMKKTEAKRMDDLVVIRAGRGRAV